MEIESLVQSNFSLESPEVDCNLQSHWFQERGYKYLDTFYKSTIHLLVVFKLKKLYHLELGTSVKIHIVRDLKSSFGLIFLINIFNKLSFV